MPLGAGKAAGGRETGQKRKGGEYEELLSLARFSLGGGGIQMATTALGPACRFPPPPPLAPPRPTTHETTASHVVDTFLLF